MSTAIESIVSLLGAAYRDALSIRHNQLLEEIKNQPYPKAPFDSRFHVHETDCGEMVRSKSEQIILNTLCTYPLIVHYEE